MAGSIPRLFARWGGRSALGGRIVRVALWICLLAVGVALTGCKTAAKDKPAPPPPIANNGHPGAPPAANVPFWADPNNANRAPAPASVNNNHRNNALPDPVGQPSNDPEISGILAGRIVDGYGRAPAKAYVQVSLIHDGKPEPIADVETVNQGHFYIRGLQPGKTYRLVARAKQDTRLMVGEVQVKPPESRLMIPLGEDLAGSNTPPIPNAPQPPQPAPRDRPASEGASSASSTAANPTNVPAPDAPWNRSPAVELGPPSAGNPDNPPADRIAITNPPSQNRSSVPTSVPPGPAIAPLQPQSFNSGPTTPNVAPSCQVIGGRVVTLRLPDVDGGSWDFQDRHGRVVLLDFWGTWCMPCLRAIPEVSRLQATYGGAGLEVIGIACERGNPADNVRRVRETRQRIPALNYKLVLANPGDRSHLQDQFHITGYPTLVLVDGEGTIIWCGGPDRVHELEGMIRRRLGF